MYNNELKLAFYLLGHQHTLMAKLLKALRNNPDNEFIREQFTNAEQQYIKTCDRARMLLDKMEHETIRLGLQFRYINRISWAEIIALLGDENVEARCMEFLKGAKR